MNFFSPQAIPGGDAGLSRDQGPEIRARSLDGTLDRPAAVKNLLSVSEQGLLQRHATLIDFRRAGMAIFSEGENGEFVYFIAQGIVRVSRCAENGHRQILAFRAAGDVFGIPDGGRYVNSAETVCAARIYRLPWQRMLQVMGSEPRLLLNLLAKVTYDYRQAELRIMMLGLQNTYQRLASFILELISLPGWFDERRRHLKLPVNRFDLADYLGTSPESTSRAFARLEQEGLLKRVNSRMVEILDVKGLETLQRGRRRSDGHAPRQRANAAE
jgi:CRP-like cAMP-binding protein